jgi:hypothetical protein
LIVSEQVAAAQTPPVQTPEAQSAATAQARPSLQAPQVPPQSTSVSVPFFTVSAQAAARHLPPLQAPVVQSAATEQPLPSTHFVAHEPPQSTSPSEPFLILSVHVGAGGGGVVVVVVGVAVGVGVTPASLPLEDEPPSSLLPQAATQGTPTHESRSRAPMVLVDVRGESRFMDDRSPRRACARIWAPRNLASIRHQKVAAQELRAAPPDRGLK